MADNSFKSWMAVTTFESVPFTCGHCGHQISSDKGFQRGTGEKIAICHMCGCPTFLLNNGKQVPGSVYGKTVEGVTDAGVTAIYEEARKALQGGAPTAAVLACRKLLMHIAVSQGADTNKKFIEYVEYLADKGYVPPGARGWVDLIRETGNEATHEIKLMKLEEAKELIDFSEMLLKVIFEFPAAVQRRKSPKLASATSTVADEGEPVTSPPSLSPPRKA